MSGEPEERAPTGPAGDRDRDGESGSGGGGGTDGASERRDGSDAEIAVDVDELVAQLGFDAERNVLTRRQAEVYTLRKRGFRQAEIAERLGTSRANVASVEASARDNVEKARNTVSFADVLAAPIRIEIRTGTDLYDVPERVFSTCDDAGVEVNHTAPELMELVSEAAGDAIRGRQVTGRISVGVSADGNVSVTRPNR